MSERLITLSLALAALAVFYSLFVPKQSKAPDLVPPPLSTESGRNGYLGARRWLDSAGVPTRSLRDRYTRLTDPAAGLTPTGNLLIVTLPQRYRMNRRELRALRGWIAAGNTVLVLAALADSPDWLQQHPVASLLHDTRSLTGIVFTAEPEPEQESPATTGAGRLAQPQRHRIVPNAPQPLFDGVTLVTAESEFPASRWRASPPADGFAVSLAHDADTGCDALLMRRYRAGVLLVSSYASLFSNAQLGRADNARLLANIVGASVGPGGTVLFDDQHHGLSELYDAEAFFADARLSTTLWLLLGLWLTWVVGAAPLRPTPTHAPAPGEATLVEAMGSFFARTLEPRQAGAGLLERFLDELRMRARLTDAAQVWQWLAGQSRLRREDLDALRDCDARLSSGRRVDLIELHNLILRVQQQL